MTDIATLPASTGAQQSPGDILFYSKRPASDNGRRQLKIVDRTGSIAFLVIESLKVKFSLGGTGCRPQAPSTIFRLGIPLENSGDPR